MQANRLEDDIDDDDDDDDDEEDEDVRNDFRYDRGDPLDDDVIGQEDIEAREVCCGEARLNCGRFSRQMKKEYEELRECASRCDCKKFLRGYFSMDVLRRRLPIINWLPKYRLPEFQGDLIAGITIGLTVIPQAIAYSSIAGVPPQYGLYSAFIGSFVYVVFGSSKDMCLGPSAVSSLLTALFATSPLHNDASFAILMTFFVGFIYIGMAIFSLGFITDFFSYPVMKAFSVAAAITIAASQVKKWFGLTGIPSDFMPQFRETIINIPHTRLYDFLLGVVCIAFIVFFKKLKEIKWEGRFSEWPLRRRILNKTLWFLGTGRNIIVLVISSVVAYIFLENGLKPFTLTGTIPAGVPSFKLPAMEVTNTTTNTTYDLNYMVSSISVGFIVVPILGILEALSIGQVFARRFNYRIDVNQELLAYGIGNVLTGLLSGYAITGTYSRTAVNAQSGVKTPMGGIYTGAIVLLGLQFLTPLLYYIPGACLAVVVIMAVIDMITFHKVWIFWKTRKIDLIPWLLTIILSFVINIAYGVIIGAGLSLILLLYPATRPQIKKLKHDAPSLLLCKHISTDGSSVILVTFNSSLMYPAMEYVKDRLIPLQTAAEQPKGVILDFQHVAVADTTAVQGVRLLLENFHRKNIPIVVCRMQKAVDKLFTKSKPKYLQKTATIEEAVALIYGLKARLPTSMSAVSLWTTCSGMVETCPWVPAEKRKKEKKKNSRPGPVELEAYTMGYTNPGFIVVGLEEEDGVKKKETSNGPTGNHHQGHCNHGDDYTKHDPADTEKFGSSQPETDTEVDGSFVKILVQMEAARMEQNLDELHPFPDSSHPLPPCHPPPPSAGLAAVLREDHTANDPAYEHIEQASHNDDDGSDTYI